MSLYESNVSISWAMFVLIGFLFSLKM